jgi:hypothetical protein
VATEQTPPRRRGPRPLYTHAQLEEARAAAAESPGWWEPSRRLRSRKAQQDFIWEAHARAVLADWQEEDIDGRELHWWAGHPPPPHSAWAELGRLRDPELIVAVARLVEAARPGGTKRAAQAIRAFRLQLNGRLGPPRREP